jgi:diadenylate cyclase
VQGYGKTPAQPPKTGVALNYIQGRICQPEARVAMPQILLPIIPKMTVTSVIDILAVALLIYNFILLLRGRRAVHVLAGLLVLAALYLVSIWLRLDLLRSVLAALAPYTAIALIVMFQAEIRRSLARLGRARWLGLGGQLERREVIDEVMLAVEQMSEARTGALIVVERDVGLRTFIESGVALDAVVSRDLLCSIFHAGGELHDGAVIIQGDRIAAAACFLPLNTHPMTVRKLGTRHRAAIGVTEEGDALAVAISEETGHISIAWRGDLEQDVSLERLRERLLQHATGRGAAPSDASGPQAAEPRLKRAQP